LVFGFVRKIKKIKKSYSPDCGYCKSFEPVLIRVSDMFKNKVKVAKIDCLSKMNENLCRGFRVEEYPTIKL
jgi:thiol-disulfide isomerase/thioredoxin